MSEASLLIPKTNPPVTSEPMANKSLTGLESLLKLLPTGTLFIYLLLNPVLTNDGECSTSNKVMSSILIALCSFSCVFSCFTDSFKGTDGSRKYGIVTRKGLWTYADPGSMDLSKYKLRIADFVHAGFVVAVFGTLVLLDANTFPSVSSTPQAVCSTSLTRNKLLAMELLKTSRSLRSLSLSRTRGRVTIDEME
ncbi:hypothetical protein Bca101_072513 [Brassica carinata]